jgi:N-glycosidase YbiA
MTGSGPRRFLSNFWPSPLTMDDGITYPTAEHAYQAHKAADRQSRAAVAGRATPGEAKEAGQRLTLRPD